MSANAAAAQPARFDAGRQHRRSMEAKIHVAIKQLAMVEDDYRELLFTATGRMSLTECSDAQLSKVIDALKAKGFRPIQKKGAAGHPVALKARALWISLYHLGAVHNRSEQALEAFAKRQVGAEKLAWMRQHEGYRLIEALKAMAVRHGWVQHDIATQKPLSPIGLQAQLCHAILAKLKAAGAAPADWALHDAAWKLCGEENARDRAWSAEDYQRLAEALGKVLRDAGGAK